MNLWKTKTNFSNGNRKGRKFTNASLLGFATKKINNNTNRKPGNYSPLKMSLSN